jgi:YD repeat-containing protein
MGSVVCAMAALIGAQGTAMSASAPTAAGSGASAQELNSLAVPGVQSLDGNQQALDARHAFLDSPEAVTAREVSRTAFRHLSAAGASKLAREAFPEVVDRPGGGPPPLRGGEKIVRYLSDHAAQLSLPGGKHAVVESLAPMAKPTSPGHFTPLNLGLSQTEGAYVPQSAIVPVKIPQRLSAGVTLGGTGVTVTPVDADGVSLSGSQGAQDGQSVLYANTQTDTDTLVKPTTAGFAIDAVLRSVDSPSKLYFKIAVPRGAHVSQSRQSALVSVVKNGKSIATILPPAAHDAVGTSVPAVINVLGDLLVLNVAHGSAELQYPVDVDPEFSLAEDKSLTGKGSDTTCGASPSETNWGFCAKNPENFWSSGWGGSGGLTDEAVSEYVANEHAAFSYQTRGESKIYEAELETQATGIQEKVEPKIWIQNEGGTQESEAHPGLPVSADYGPTNSVVCARYESGCVLEEWKYGSPKNTVVYQQTTTGNGKHFTDTLKKATVRITQSNPPETTLDTTSPTFPKDSGKINALYGQGAWLGPHVNTAIHFWAKDPGVGVYADAVEYQGKSNFENLTGNNFYEEGKCAGIQCPSEIEGYAEYIGGKGLPDGNVAVRINARDAMPGSWNFEHGKGAQATVKVDSTPPYNPTLIGLPSNGVINESQYHLRAEVTDGTASIPSSGVKSLKLGINGRVLPATKSGSCTPGPCTAVSEWTINGEALGAGKHTLELLAGDNAENYEAAPKKYPITVRHAGSLAAGPGSVDPITGALMLSANDVSIGTGDGSLGVSRSYDSRQLKAGEEGVLGPQWQFTISGAQEIEQEPAGSVSLVALAGSRTTFESNGKGGFISPPGDENLVLSAEEVGGKVKAYQLKDRAAGTTVKYEQSGGVGPWVVVSRESALSTKTGEKETYLWERVEGITRPKMALAPEPAGVSGCATTFVNGCRALTFAYATTTTATGEEPGQWKDFKGRLKAISFKAYNPSTKAVESKVVAEYSYDKQGRLRAEWDPRISPALKTTYGYDEEEGGHVVALSPAGQEPWLFHYGTTGSDSSTGRLLSVTRPPAGTALGTGGIPVLVTAPQLFPTPPIIGTPVAVVAGTWTNSLAASYQWEDCYTYESKETCTPIPGAVNTTYRPQARDAGYTLRALETAVDADGSAVASTAASSVSPVTAPAYLRKWGASGETEGNFKYPSADAIDPSGNVWVTDYSNNRIEEFNSTGTFLRTLGFDVKVGGKSEYEICTSSCKAGLAGSGNGQFSGPRGITVSPSGNIYVVDQGNNRVEEFNSSFAFVRAFGKKGTEPGEFQSPVSVAISPNQAVWVGDYGNNRVDEFTELGAFIGSFGTVGEGVGQFKGPYGIAFSEGNAYVVDQGNNRVEEFSLSGEYIRKFGSKGAGEGQLEVPYGIATEPVSGDLYVDDWTHGRFEEFNPAGTFVGTLGAKGTGNGQLEGPESAAVNASGYVYVADPGNNRVDEFEPKYSTSNPPPTPPALTTSAVTTIDYNVPLWGSSAPDTKASNEAEEKAERKEWGQVDDPVEATAVFAPDEPMGWPAKDYKRAAISYYDELGRTVNAVAPSGAISTSEYNEDNEVIRSLSPDNRTTALAEGTVKAREETSALLDTKQRYNGETTAEKEQEEKEEKEHGIPAEPGTRRLQTWEPQHKIKVGLTSEKLARNHVQYFYNEGAPGNELYDLVTKTVDSAEYEGSNHEERVMTKNYSGQENLGWLLRKPTSVTTEPTGLHLTTTTVYDPNTGKVVETRSPAGSSSSPASLTKFAVSSLASKPGLAIDRNGNLWVVGENKLEVYSSAGTKLKTVGAKGTGNGQFEAPTGIAIGPGNTVWVTDKGNNRVEELNEEGTWLKTVGAAGEGNGQFKEPEGIAFGPNGALWISDAGNNRVQEFTDEGIYFRQFGSKGEGNGQFKAPAGIAVTAEGDLWVVDSGNNRVEEFNDEGGYLRKFGEYGSGNGQFNETPYYIAIDANGNLWVDGAAGFPISRVQEFSPGGEFVAKAGNGWGVAVDGKGDVWVVKSGKELEELAAPSSYLAKVYRKQAETTGYGALSAPSSVTSDASGDRWVLNAPSASTDYLTEYSSSGGFIEKYKWLGEKKEPRGPTTLVPRYGNSEHFWMTDPLHQRLIEVGIEHTKGGIEGLFFASGEISGEKTGERFGEATGVASGPTGLWVLGMGGSKLMWFFEGGTMRGESSGGPALKGAKGIAIDAKGDVLVADTGENCVVEYNREGKYIRTIGSLGAGNGQLSGPTGITGTDAAGDIWVADTGNHRLEEFNGKGEYLTQLGAKGKGAGQFEAPSGVTTGSEGDVWATDSENNTLQKFGQAGSAKGAHDSETIYYTAAENSTTPACGQHPEWAELPCQSQPAAQPGTVGLPALPVVVDKTYNMWDEPEQVEEKFEKIGIYPETTRTKKMTYDSAGRLETNEETATSGTSLPKVTNVYSKELGVMTEQSTTVGATTKSIKSKYNELGLLTEYTDADSNKTVYAYDIDGRAKEVKYGLKEGAEIEAKQTYAYNTTSGGLEQLVDSAAGTFTASYDSEGRLSAEVYPDALTAKYTYNPLGEATAIKYEKTADCKTTCPEVWFEETTVPKAHGETAVRTSTLAKEEYGYDGAGRLAETIEAVVGKTCHSRLYGYDEDSNRLSEKIYNSSNEECEKVTGTTTTHSYDSADRLIDSGVAYDALGNRTKIPAADTEEKAEHELTATFYVDNQTQSQTQNGKTITYYTDPTGRTRETTTKEGAGALSTIVNHYAGAGEAISWVGEEGGAWTRNISGIDGSLSATAKNGAEATLQLHDLQGNVVATAKDTETETKLLTTYNSTEFGVPVNGAPPSKYAWLGASGISAELPSSGGTSQGGTGYVPSLGEALQTQPVVSPGAPNGSYVTPYISTVSSGVIAGEEKWAAGGAEREAARQLAAKIAACNANPASCSSGSVGSGQYIDPWGCSAEGGLGQVEEWKGHRTGPFFNLKCHNANPNGYFTICVHSLAGAVIGCGGATKIGAYANGKSFAVIAPVFQCKPGEGYIVYLGYFQIPFKTWMWYRGHLEICEEDVSEKLYKAYGESGETVVPIP